MFLHIGRCLLPHATLQQCNKFGLGEAVGFCGLKSFLYLCTTKANDAAEAVSQLKPKQWQRRLRIAAINLTIKKI